MKKILTTTKYITLGLVLLFGFSYADNASAAWVYTNYSIPYTVPAAANLPPIVDAGPDKNIVQPANSVSVTGTASDPDGTIASTQWTKVSGPSTYTIGNPSSLTSLMNSLNTVGTYVFRLTATDNLGLSASDDMQIVVGAPSLAPDLIAGSVSPSSAMVGSTITLQSTITNIGNDTTGSSFSNFFQVASGSNGSGTVTDLASSSMSTLVSGGSSTASKSYSFSTTGTKSVRACADKTSSSNNGVITESSESNNCGPWTDILITTNVVNGSCSSAHYSCNSGSSANNTEGSSSWSWMCIGSNGGSNSSCTESKTVTYQCSDGIDNDGDKKIDYKDEPTADPAKEGDSGCSSGQDNDERNIKPIYIEN